jgi:hypothetical protein
MAAFLLRPFVLSVFVAGADVGNLRAPLAAVSPVVASSSSYVTLSFHVGKQCSHPIRYNATFATNVCFQASGQLAAMKSGMYVYGYSPVGLYLNIYSSTACASLLGYQGLFVVPGLGAGACSGGRSYSLSASPAIIQDGASYISYYTSATRCVGNIPLQTTTFFPAEGYVDDTMGVGDDVEIANSDDDYAGSPGVGAAFQNLGSFSCKTFTNTKLVDTPGSTINVKNVYVSALSETTTSSPTVSPTVEASSEPTLAPTTVFTFTPTVAPSDAPTNMPVALPTVAPTSSISASAAANIKISRDVAVSVAIVGTLLLLSCSCLYYFFCASSMMKHGNQKEIEVRNFNEAVDSFGADINEVNISESSVHVDVEYAPESVGVRPELVLSDDGSQANN